MTSNPSTANAHQQLIQRLLDNLPVGYAVSDVKLPNRAFNTPENSNWVRPTVIDQTAENVQAGGLWKRKDGLFVIDVFTPVGNDDLQAIQDAELFGAIFENQRFNGVNCQELLIQVLGTNEGWYQVQCEINFYYEGYTGA